MKKVFVIVFIAVITLCGMGTFLSGEKSFSYNENRYLQELPKATAENIKTGDFQKELTAFTQDHFPARDFLMKLSTGIKISMGIRDIGGAYLGRNNMYFEKILDKDITMSRYVNNLKRINSIGKLKKTDVMLVPSAAIIYDENLPSGAISYNYSEMIKTAEKTLADCTLIDIYTPIKNRKKDYLYYRTDHHWTLEGALCAYESYKEKRASFETEVFSDEFLGTLYSKTLDPIAKKHPDTVYIPSGYDSFKITADGKTKNLIDRNAEKEKDKYKVFLGGNYGKVVIKGSGKGRLLVIKDSFANSIVPLMIRDYEEIVMADMRYFSGDIKELVQGADSVLVIYETTNFANDTNISKI